MAHNRQDTKDEEIADYVEVGSGREQADGSSPSGDVPELENRDSQSETDAASDVGGLDNDSQLSDEGDLPEHAQTGGGRYN